MPRQFSRQIDPIPEYEPDFVTQTTPTATQNISNNRYPSSNTLATANVGVPSSMTVPKSSSTKRLSNPNAPTSSKQDDFVLVPDQGNVDKSLPSGKKEFLLII